MKLLLISILVCMNLYSLELGEIPKYLELSGENGCVVKTKETWTSKNIKNKLNVILYVDPDKKEINSDFITKLLEDNKDNNKVDKIAIVNTKSSWKPSFLIDQYIKRKQEDNPNVLFLKDNNKILVKKWGLKDEDTNILILSEYGNVMFVKSGKLNDNDKKEIERLISEVI